MQSARRDAEQLSLPRSGSSVQPWVKPTVMYQICDAKPRRGETGCGGKTLSPLRGYRRFVNDRVPGADATRLHA